MFNCKISSSKIETITITIIAFSFILDRKGNSIGFPPPEKMFSRLSLFFPTLRARRGIACAGRSIYQPRQFMVEAA